MALDDFGGNSRKDPQAVIRERLPDNLVSLALEIDQAVRQVVSEENYRVEGSGDGVTYYPGSLDYARYAFMTIQPNRGGSYLYLHFDTSAKQRVSAKPIPSSAIKSAYEIPANWKWNGSFNLTLEIERSSNVDENVREAIKRSLDQLRR